MVMSMNGLGKLAAVVKAAGGTGGTGHRGSGAGGTPAAKASATDESQLGEEVPAWIGYIPLVY